MLPLTAYAADDICAGFRFCLQTKSSAMCVVMDGELMVMLAVSASVDLLPIMRCCLYDFANILRNTIPPSNTICRFRHNSSSEIF